MNELDRAWEEWFIEKNKQIFKEFLDNYTIVNRDAHPEPIDFIEIFWDSMAGLGLLMIIWLWLPGLGALKLYRWLSK